MEDSQDPEPIAPNNLEHQPGTSAASFSRSQPGPSPSYLIPRCEIFVVFFSSRSLKMGEKCISFAQFVYFLREVFNF